MGNGLSDRERQVLQMVADGMEPGEIALRLGLAGSSVRSLLSRCMRRTDTTSTLQSVLVAVRRGWVRAPALTPTDDVIWRERLEAALLLVERRLLALTAEPALSPEMREYLGVLDEHLAARTWDEIGLDDTRRRMRVLVDRLTGREAR